MFLFLMGGLSASAVSCRAPGGDAGEELALLGTWDFEAGDGEGWEPRRLENWRIVEERGNRAYELVTAGEQGPVRAPASWSIMRDVEVGSFIFTGRMKCTADPANDKRDLCVFFHFEDPLHFYYVHFSASSDDVHNIIGLVNGTDRIKINVEAAGGSRAGLTDEEWHTFKITRNAGSGETEVFLDDMIHPILTAVDTTFLSGRIGVGSFDDTGLFDDLVLRGDGRGGNVMGDLEPGGDRRNDEPVRRRSR